MIRNPRRPHGGPPLSCAVARDRSGDQRSEAGIGGSILQTFKKGACEPLSVHGSKKRVCVRDPNPKVPKSDETHSVAYWLSKSTSSRYFSPRSVSEPPSLQGAFEETLKLIGAS